MVLNRENMESSSHRATKRSSREAVVVLLSRVATRPTLERMCLVGRNMSKNNLSEKPVAHGAYSQIDLVRVVRSASYHTTINAISVKRTPTRLSNTTLRERRGLLCAVSGLPDGH